MNHEIHMRRAVELAQQSVSDGGGPFGAVITKDGQVVAEATNRVTQTSDPTAHAEVVAIRRATEALGTHDLSGCTIYASCEPCPMCLGAIYWAHISEVLFSATREDAKAAGFDDAHIYNEIGKSIADRSISMAELRLDTTRLPFEAWEELDDKIEY